MNINKQPALVYKQYFNETFHYKALLPCLVTTYFWQSVLHLSSCITFWFSEAENCVDKIEQQKMGTLVTYNSHFFNRNGQFQ